MSGTPAPLSTVQPLTPVALDRIVRKCLVKDPDGRWQSASDLEDELKWVAEGAAGAPVVAATSSASRTRSARVAWASAAALAIALTVVGLLFIRERARPNSAGPATLKLAATLPDGWDLTTVGLSGVSTAPVAVSPDGRRIAFVAISSDKKTSIWIRPLDSVSALPLAGTEGGTSPFWSPDSRFLGFFAGGSLKKVDTSGGPVVTLCAAPNDLGGTWGASGVIVFALRAGPLQKVRAEGGVPAPATQLGKGETGQWRPSFLPDGRHFIYRTGPSGEKGPFHIGSLDSFDRTLAVHADSSNAIYSQGHLLFLLGSTLMAQRFDAERREISGEPFPVAEEIQIQGNAGIFSASNNGVLVYRAGDSLAGGELSWMDRSGKALSTLGDPGSYGDLELSPDGKRLALSVRSSVVSNAQTDVWIIEIDRNVRTRFTSDPAAEAGPRWTRDGRTIAYSVAEKGIFVKSSGGAGGERRLVEGTHEEYPDSWSADDSLLYERIDPTTSWDLWLLAPRGAAPVPFIPAPFRQEYARFSPDSRWVSYQSNESGREEIYVVPFPGPGDRVQVSTNGGRFARWRGDGKEMFYFAPDHRLMSVQLDTRTATLTPGAPVPLFETEPVYRDWPYDVSSDGQRFIINTRTKTTTATPLTVVVNWTAGLNSAAR
jgi:Tol biopolymer transport system component